jgi:hypothetical protein
LLYPFARNKFHGSRSAGAKHFRTLGSEA